MKPNDITLKLNDITRTCELLGFYEALAYRHKYNFHMLNDEKFEHYMKRMRRIPGRVKQLQNARSRKTTKIV